ncbi:Cucumisin [Handroanthus impetiginosus]|uniref:Cucumisin n=1 Tax=Handroanthus impetiginosus TaxID=429701 RepID=A0A2G9HB17_9LAMI|nr:Cucumisin [Handroanthus impetiginosus]
MAKNLIFHTFFTVCLLQNIAFLTNASNDDGRKTYIVYMGDLPEETPSLSLMDVHHNLLADAIGDETLARNSKIHTYGRSFNAFAARLLPHEVKLLSQKEGVVSVFPNKVQKPLTTRSWDFIGLPIDVRRNHRIESDLIIGLFDTGIWTESPSFDDKGFGPPPPKWKGKCDKAVNFTGCNNKVIGAQYFQIAKTLPRDATSPLDTEGHGTHTASTIAGVPVKGANLYGLATGTARGGVPSARIASYKVCWPDCQDIDILAAFDAAIADGVDIISASLGANSRIFFQDSVAVGSLHALKKGILTVCAAGNSGPDLSTVQNVAPWILTVGASTIDRKFQTDLQLGNGEKISSGIAINTYAPKKEFYPLTNGPHAQYVYGDFYFGNVSACEYGTLNETKVKGKILYCQEPGGDSVIKALGGVGTIMTNDQYIDTAFAAVGPGTYVSFSDGEKIDKYINSTRNPKVVIYKTRTVSIAAPSVASFSARGPQKITPQILKPDISAPGVGILAAYTKFATLSERAGDDRVVKYNVQSGTSMSCPHVAGAAAYVKSFHPTWSPSAIKSALMTTTKEIKIKPVERELAYGSGELNPTKALNPGLVYNNNIESYISFLCKQGYEDRQISILAGTKKYNCSTVRRAKGADGLNYPSIYLPLNNNESDVSAVFYRTVTNVGKGKSVYNAEVTLPRGLSIVVTPEVLKFSRVNQKKSFKVILKGKLLDNTSSLYLSGSLVWSNSKYSVKSPILLNYKTNF